MRTSAVGDRRRILAVLAVTTATTTTRRGRGTEAEGPEGELRGRDIYERRRRLGLGPGDSQRPSFCESGSNPTTQSPHATHVLRPSEPRAVEQHVAHWPAFRLRSHFWRAGDKFLLPVKFNTSYLFRDVT